MQHQKIVLSVAIIAASFAGGYWVHQPPVGAQTAAARKPLYYQCPMHPSFHSDKPGDAPCCGMKLVPVYSGDAAGPNPGSIGISAEKQQLIGLATVRVTRSSGSHTIRLLGRVAADETRVHRVTALADGVVRMVSPYAVGNIVQKDAVLASYYVSMPEVYSAIQSYFVAMSALEQGVSLRSDPNLSSQSNAQTRISEELLKTYGLTEPQMREMARTRQATRDVEFRSPVTGVVLVRNIGLGQRAVRGDELFRVADLSRVWVWADVFEGDAPMVRAGMSVLVRYRDRAYQALIADALPPFDPVSRTLKVRIELDNPDLMLRPNMFVDAEFEVQEPDGITVSADAVLESGLRKSVFVKTGEGRFESREVTTGQRYADRIQITSGIADGDTVVVSGMFLLDSESRLQSSAMAAPKPPAAEGATVDPVCGMEVEPGKTAHHMDLQGVTYHFCSKSCKEKFDADPSRYTAKKGGRS